MLPITVWQELLLMSYSAISFPGPSCPDGKRTEHSWKFYTLEVALSNDRAENLNFRPAKENVVEKATKCFIT